MRERRKKMEQLNSVLIEGVLVEDVRKERKGPYWMKLKNVRGEKEFQMDLMYKGTNRKVRALKAGMVLRAVGPLEPSEDGLYINAKHMEYKVDRKLQCIDEEE